MNSEYHNLPVPYFLNSDYNEYRETGNLLHIEGVSSCTDAENIDRRILKDFKQLTYSEKSEILFFVLSLFQSEPEEALSDPST